MTTGRATGRSRAGTWVACGVGVLALAAGAAAPVPAGASTRMLSAATTAQKAHATKALLRHSDLPSGWTTSPGSNNSGSGSFPGAAQLAGCIGVPSQLIASNPPEVNSPNFHSKDQTLEVDDNVSVFPSVKNARAEYAAISNAKTAGCMATLMNGSFKTQIASAAGSGASVGTITVTKAGAPKGTTAYDLGVPITSQGVVVPLHLVITYFIKGQYGQNITFYGYGIPFPSTLERHLMATAQARL